jgi:hypothetical protein
MIWSWIRTHKGLIFMRAGSWIRKSIFTRVWLLVHKLGLASTEGMNLNEVWFMIKDWNLHKGSPYARICRVMKRISIFTRDGIVWSYGHDSGLASLFSIWEEAVAIGYSVSIMWQYRAWEPNHCLSRFVSWKNRSKKHSVCFPFSDPPLRLYLDTRKT